jgi:hypothetical protein
MSTTEWVLTEVGDEFCQASARDSPILILHYEDISADEVEEREGYRVTSPIRTIVDVRHEVSNDVLSQAFNEAKTRGLVIGADVERYRAALSYFMRPGTLRI